MNQNDKFHQDAQNVPQEINEEALDNVAGGIDYLFPELICPHCGEKGKWGYYDGRLRCMACMKFRDHYSTLGGQGIKLT